MDQFRVVQTVSYLIWMVAVMNKNVMKVDVMRVNKYFYTFGTDSQFPYQRGWVEVRAADWDEAHLKFSTRFPDVHKNVLNCAFYYDERQFIESGMTGGNMREFCHEIIE